MITDEYFQRVTQALIMRLRQHEEAVIRDGKRVQQPHLLSLTICQSNLFDRLQQVKNIERSLISVFSIFLWPLNGPLILVSCREWARWNEAEGLDPVVRRSTK